MWISRGTVPGAVLALVFAWRLLAWAGDQETTEEEQKAFKWELRRWTELALGPSLAERAVRWRCEPARWFVCSLRGCEEKSPTIWVELDFPTRKYRRCDAKGCDSHDLAYSQSGAFTTVMMPTTAGGFLKAANAGHEYTEVVSLWTGVWAYFGRCSPVK